jgi:hypothetical protein
LKNETNSVCWSLASKLGLAAGRPITVTVQRIDKKTMAVFSAALGKTPKFSTAAVWGPLLVWHNLGHYLEKRYPAAVGETKIRIRATDYAMLNDVLAYCRGLTHYSKTITR